MLKKIITLLLFFAFLLAACGAEVQTPESGGTVQEESPAPEVTEAEESEAASAEEPTDEPQAESEPGEFVSQCSIAGSLAEAPTQFEELFAVSDSDWVVGPEDAAITIVEYGDFQ